MPGLEMYSYGFVMWDLSLSFGEQLFTVNIEKFCSNLIEGLRMETKNIKQLATQILFFLCYSHSNNRIISGNETNLFWIRRPIW